MFKRRLFLASTPLELKGLIRHCSQVRREESSFHWAASGLFRGKPMLAVANGAGRQRAYMAVAGSDVDLVCNIGLCGALAPEMRVGDILISEEGSAQLHSSRPSICGRLFTSDHVVVSVAEKQQLRAAGYSAVEMEAAGAMQRCLELRIPFCAVKIVSDLASEELRCPFNAALRDDGRVEITRLLFEALKHPFTCLPELVGFGRRVARCSDRLGDFLASCDI